MKNCGQFAFALFLLGTGHGRRTKLRDLGDGDKTRKLQKASNKSGLGVYGPPQYVTPQYVTPFVVQPQYAIPQAAPGHPARSVAAPFLVLSRPARPLYAQQLHPAAAKPQPALAQHDASPSPREKTEYYVFVSRFDMNLGRISSAVSGLGPGNGVLQTAASISHGGETRGATIHELSAGAEKVVDNSTHGVPFIYHTEVMLCKKADVPHLWASPPALGSEVPQKWWSKQNVKCEVLWYGASKNNDLSACSGVHYEEVQLARTKSTMVNAVEVPANFFWGDATLSSVKEFRLWLCHCSDWSVLEKEKLFDPDEEKEDQGSWAACVYHPTKYNCNRFMLTAVSALEDRPSEAWAMLGPFGKHYNNGPVSINKKDDVCKPGRNPPVEQAPKPED